MTKRVTTPQASITTSYFPPAVAVWGPVLRYVAGRCNAPQEEVRELATPPQAPSACFYPPGTPVRGSLSMTKRVTTPQASITTSYFPPAVAVWGPVLRYVAGRCNAPQEEVRELATPPQAPSACFYPPGTPVRGSLSMTKRVTTPQASITTSYFPPAVAVWGPVLRYVAGRCNAPQEEVRELATPPQAPSACFYPPGTPVRGSLSMTKRVTTPQASITTSYFPPAVADWRPVLRYVAGRCNAPQEEVRELATPPQAPSACFYPPGTPVRGSLSMTKRVTTPQASITTSYFPPAVAVWGPVLRYVAGRCNAPQEEVRELATPPQAPSACFYPPGTPVRGSLSMTKRVTTPQASITTSYFPPAVADWRPVLRYVAGRCNAPQEEVRELATPPQAPSACFYPPGTPVRGSLSMTKRVTTPQASITTSYFPPAVADWRPVLRYVAGRCNAPQEEVRELATPPQAPSACFYPPGTPVRGSLSMTKRVTTPQASITTSYFPPAVAVWGPVLRYVAGRCNAPQEEVRELATPPQAPSACFYPPGTPVRGSLSMTKRVTTPQASITTSYFPPAVAVWGPVLRYVAGRCNAPQEEVRELATPPQAPSACFYPPGTPVRGSLSMTKRVTTPQASITTSYFPPAVAVWGPVLRYVAGRCNAPQEEVRELATPPQAPSACFYPPGTPVRGSLSMTKRVTTPQASITTSYFPPAVAVWGPVLRYVAGRCNAPQEEVRELATPPQAPSACFYPPGTPVRGSLSMTKRVTTPQASITTSYFPPAVADWRPVLRYVAGRCNAPQEEVRELATPPQAPSACFYPPGTPVRGSLSMTKRVTTPQASITTSYFPPAVAVWGPVLRYVAGRCNAPQEEVRELATPPQAPSACFYPPGTPVRGSLSMTKRVTTPQASITTSYFPPAVADWGPVLRYVAGRCNAPQEEVRELATPPQAPSACFYPPGTPVRGSLSMTKRVTTPQASITTSYFPPAVADWRPVLRYVAGRCNAPQEEVRELATPPQAPSACFYPPGTPVRGSLSMTKRVTTPQASITTSYFPPAVADWRPVLRYVAGRCNAPQEEVRELATPPQAPSACFYPPAMCGV